jgi:iron complex outermembrane receptor protein
LTYLRVPAQQEQDNEEHAFQLNLTGDFGIGGMRNRLFVGVDYRDTSTAGQTRFDPTTPYFLDWRNPDYSQLPPPLESIPVAEGFYAVDDIERIGLYLQNHLSLTENTVVSLGARRDEVDRDPRPGSSSTAQDISQTSFQGGVIHALNDAVSVFASYSESFTPNYELDRFGDVLEPTTGDGWEVGLKGDLFDGRLGFSTAYFDITEQNVATPDPNAGPSDPNPFGSIATGEQRGRGFEIDFSGLLANGIEVFGAYGYTDSEITRSNNGDQGLAVVGAPDHTASLWGSYRLAGNLLTGLDVSLGVQYVGERLAVGDPNFDGDTSDAVFVDDYVLLNAAFGYQLGKWEFALNVNNLTDEEYVDAAWGGLARSVHAGAPREVVGTVIYNF